MVSVLETLDAHIFSLYYFVEKNILYNKIKRDIYNAMRDILFH
jgi:hypothetical protein